MKPNASHEASVAQNEAMDRRAEPTREVDITGGCGLHAEESSAKSSAVTQCLVSDGS